MNRPEHTWGISVIAISVVQHRDIDDARTYIDRKLSEGNTRREARGAHKRHLANRTSAACGKPNPSAANKP